MKPRVGSYGDTATVTRSPRTTRMRWRRTLPASFARTSWPLSSLTRKLPPFAIKMTSPSRCTSSSLDTEPLEGPWLALTGRQEKRFGHQVLYTCWQTKEPMDRQPPRATSDEIDLYIRTYYSLLRSSGDVRVRAFEEAHLFSRSSLHLGAESLEPDLAAFGYSAGRLPDCMPRIRRLVLGQSPAQFRAAGFPIEKWEIVRT